MVCKVRRKLGKINKNLTNSRFLFIPMFHSEILSSLNFNKNYNLVPWTGEQPHIEILFRQFPNINMYVKIVGKMPDQHFNV